MTGNRKYIFGPVPSRRLGLSLGVDLVPRKVCTQDCVYCQVGRTTVKTVRRGDFVPLQEVLDELGQVLAGLDHASRPDYITISGSGEPTLNSRLGEFLAAIRLMTDIPIAILTNGSLLGDPEVRAECVKADLVAPSLDAGDEETFRKVNRPADAAGMTLGDLVEGLAAFRREFAGQYWLEVFLIEGLNDSTEQVLKIKKLIERIRPDRIQLNTATRPTAEIDVRPVSPERLAEFARLLGPTAEVIATFKPRELHGSAAAEEEAVLAMIRRRPVTAEDIAAGLSAHPNEVAKLLGHLVDKGLIVATARDGRTYFEAAEKPR